MAKIFGICSLVALTIVGFFLYPYMIFLGQDLPKESFYSGFPFLRLFGLFGKKKPEKL
jgi:hypothetical protein